jgi:hypothetical protein
MVDFAFAASDTLIDMEETESKSVAIPDIHQISGWMDYFGMSEPAEGVLDIVCAGPIPRLKAAAAFAATFLALSKFEVAIVYPSDDGERNAGTKLTHLFFAQVLDTLAEGYAAKGQEFDRAVAEKSLGQITFKVPESLQTSELVEFAKSRKPGSAIFVCSAELFKATATRATVDTSFKTEEDLWVQSVNRTVAELGSVAVQQKLFILLFVQKYGPIRKENTGLLESFHNVTLVTMKPPQDQQDADNILINHGSRWEDLARQQRIDELFEEIDGQPLTPIDRAMVKAQILIIAGRPLLAFSVIEPFISNIRDETSAQIALNVARIANEAGEYNTALELLRVTIRREFLTELELSKALDIAKSLRADEEAEEISQRILKLYPRSITALDHRLKTANKAEDFAKLASDLLPEIEREYRPDVIYFAYLLASKFARNEIPDYEQVVREIAAELPAYRLSAISQCARHALRHGLFKTVIDLTGNEGWPNSRGGLVAWYVVSAIEGLFLSKPDEEASAAEEKERLILNGLTFLLRYLAENQSDEYIRAMLYRTVSPETSGITAIICLAQTLLLSRPPGQLTPDEDGSPPDLPSAELERLFESVAAKLPKPIILGLGRLPIVESESTMASFLRFLTLSLQDASLENIADEEDVQFLHLLVHVAILVSREIGKEEEYAPKILRIAAAGLAASGQYQAARNLAELGLQLSVESSPAYKRGSWVAYADIYSRCHNPVEALISIGIAQQCAIESMSFDSRYDELSLSGRILRELRLFPLASHLLLEARKIADQTSHSEHALARIEYLEASLQFQAINWHSTGEPATDRAIEELTQRVVELNRKARDQGRESLPTAMLLAQIISSLSLKDLPIAPEAEQELSHSLPLVAFNHAELLQALASADASAKTIADLSLRLSRTRYNEDFGTDVHVITLLARRALAKSAQSGNTQESLFLIEWLTDLATNTAESDQLTRSDEVQVAELAIRTHTQRGVGQTTAASKQEELVRLTDLSERTDPSLHLGLRYPSSPDELENFTKSVSTTGIDVHSIGVSDLGKLVRVSATDEKTSVTVEPVNVFDVKAHHDWAKTLPYGYLNFPTDDPFGWNNVEQSLAGIGLSIANDNRPTLLIPDVRLQNIPPNLILVEERCAGQAIPMAAAPSLTWLKGIRSVDYVPNGRRTAWIPASTDVALIRLADELGETLRDNQFTLAQDPAIPPAMSNSDIAIIGAHGGLQPGDEWFRAVTDEVSVRFSARDIAAKLHGSAVVILFVCSGGRLDHHPFASAGVGLSRLLLDYGCRTVIASPWPLEVRVAWHWLTPFLRSYLAGESVIVANHTANKAVAAQLNSHPMLSLAMNVFGDPLTSFV